MKLSKTIKDQLNERRLDLYEAVHSKDMSEAEHIRVAIHELRLDLSRCDRDY